jgi:hypothetical protein
MWFNCANRVAEVTEHLAGGRRWDGNWGLYASPRKPIIGIAACCARAASGYVATAPPNPAMNSRRRIHGLPALGSALPGLQVGGPDHIAPVFGLRFDPRGESLRSTCGHQLETLRQQALLDVRPRHDRDYLAI